MANLVFRKIGVNRATGQLLLVQEPAGTVFRNEFFGIPPAPSAGNLKYWTGSAWVAKPLKYWTGSAWVEKPLKRWTGSAWVSV